MGRTLPEGVAFLSAFREPTEFQLRDFEAIDVIGDRPSMDECFRVAEAVIAQATAAKRVTSLSRPRMR